MPRWSKDTKEFEVNVHYSDDKGSQIRVPKPILEKIGEPDKVKFVIDGRSVKFLPVKSEVEQAREAMKLKKQRRGRGI